MKYLKAVLTARYSILETVLISVAAILISQQHWLPALTFMVVGSLLFVVLSGWHKKHDMERQWQQLLEQGYKIDAIKRHRQLYGSSLKEAVDVINSYQQQLPKFFN